MHCSSAHLIWAAVGFREYRMEMEELMPSHLYLIALKMLIY